MTPTFAVPSTFLTRRGFFSFSILNPFSLGKVISMNRPVAPLSSNAFTATPLWFFNFSSPTFSQTSLSGWGMCRTSLTLSVVLVKLDLLPSFSGRNTLYRLLEASRELTVLYCLLLTPVAFLLLSPFSTYPNNFWPYGPTSRTHSRFCLLPFLCPHPLHLGLSLDPFDFGWAYSAPCIPYCCFLLSMWSVLLFLHMILYCILLSHWLMKEE